MTSVYSSAILPGSVTELTLSAKIIDDHVYPRTTIAKAEWDPVGTIGEVLLVFDRFESLPSGGSLSSNM